MVVALFDAVGLPRPAELRGWAEELAASDPALAGHPQAAAVLGSAAEAAYHRGDHAEADRLARAGLGPAPGDAGLVLCRDRAGCAALAAGAFAEAVEHGLAAAQALDEALGHPRDRGARRALRGDLARARELQERAAASARLPDGRGFWPPTSRARSTTWPGRRTGPKPQYARRWSMPAGRARPSPRRSRGRAAVRAGTRAGRTHDALRGYRRLLGLLRAGRQLDPPVDGAAQPRRPAARASATRSRPR